MPYAHVCAYGALHSGARNLFFAPFERSANVDNVIPSYFGLFSILSSCEATER